MKYYVDTKLTIWHRAYWEFPDDMAEEDVLEGIDNLEIPDSSEYLYQTVEELSILNNNGKATREVYKDDGELIAKNGQ